jgi:hypothetical protein
VANVIEAEGLFVLAHGEDPIFDGEIFAGEDEVNARVSGGPRNVDTADASVRVRGAEKFAVDHAGKGNVIGEASLAGDFGAGVDAAAWVADYAKVAIISVGFLWRSFWFRHRSS